VFNQEMLSERNVVSGADLVTYTPSLSVNQRFGSDQASFAIRGFTQEFRTTASVAVYFADVVAPRGGGSVTAGDGAGPGSFFDLQNVQVLKGPQGTLFGRNTTGGAIQLTPQEPTTSLEGYLELSGGNYDMRRAQGVVNVPLNDNARARIGIDTMKRAGYIKNISGIGPDRFSDIDYLSGRASLMLDLGDSLQNYTIFSTTSSENNGTLQGLFACKPGGPLEFVCQPTLASQRDDFYTIASDSKDPTSKLKQWQLINTTTWDASDALTVKNILSYAHLEQTMRGSVFGSNFILPGGSHLSFYPAGQWPGIPTNSQNTFVEELQLSGTALDDKLSWQGGIYYENSRPDGWSGTRSPTLIVCDPDSLGSDPTSWQCQNSFSAGNILSQLGKVEYLNTAAYSQATYDISDEFRFTAGLRYTVDKTEGKNQQVVFDGFPLNAPGQADPVFGHCLLTTAEAPECKQNLEQKSEAPTWLLDFNYLPSPDVMLYVKYARGYRQGSINPFGAEGVQTFEPEEVNSYETGAKTSFHGIVSGTFNVALFYNKLKNQQLQALYSSLTAAPTTGILNAGSSTIQGAEVETTLELYDGLVLNIAYTYLDTELNEVDVTAPTAGPFAQPGSSQTVSAVEGGPLSLSPENMLLLGLNYELPLPAEVGTVSVGASYTYIDEQFQIDSKYGTLPSRNLVNFNASWKSIMASSFDASLFVTNVTDEEITANVTGLYESAGADFRVTGEPRMYGARLRYSF